MRGDGLVVKTYGCWRCRRGRNRLRRHVGIARRDGIGALMRQVSHELERAHARGRWKRQMRELARFVCELRGWSERSAARMPRRSSLPPALIEYEIRGALWK